MIRSLPAALLALAATAAQASTSGVVISQIYGGGGNSGAPWRNDFVELYNAGPALVSLSGWSLQYSSATGTSWGNQKVGLAGSLAPGQYLLVQLGSGGSAGNLLPAAEASGTFNMSATAGKVALVSNGTSLPAVTCPSDPAIVDLVGYGSTANCSEAAAAPAPSSSTAVLRGASGCTDTDNNASDFAAGAPSPRNGASTFGTCSAVIAEPATIPEIQGSGSISPLLGRTVKTSGVVTLKTNNGFFIQDAAGDGNPDTSDGLFVFAGGTASVLVGQLVELNGVVAEFNTGAATNADTAAHPVTELTGVSGITVRGSGFTVPPVEVVLPEAVDGELERVEGMLVTLRGPLVVSQNFFLGRYGQLTLSAGARMENPTNRHRPGPDAQALADANARARILLDDGTSQQNPNPTPYLAADNTVRAGDRVESVTGVIDYGLATNDNTRFGDYKIHPTVAPVITRVNARTAAPVAPGGNLRVASANVLNFFTTFGDGSNAAGQTGQVCTQGSEPPSAGLCRGADNAAEFARQRSKIVEALAALDADVVGLMELQNNGPVAIGNLVDALNARVGAGTWSAVADPVGGTGTDAIKVGLIYRAARVALHGAARADTDPVHNRPPLAQTFVAPNGERFSVIVNHFKSKGCDGATGADLDLGDGQGCWNERRRLQAAALLEFVADLKASSGSDDVLVLGDLNAYAQEDPVADLAAGGLADQVARFIDFGYSYVFDGAAGRLDHALASEALAGKVSGVAEWHINADEPSVIDYNTEFRQPACATCGPDYYTPTAYRAADHDPVLVGLAIYKTLAGGAGRDTLAGTPGDDRIVGGEGADSLTGGAGADLFVYQSLRDAGDTITDFVPGQDRVDLAALLAAQGIDPGLALAQGAVRVVASAAGAQVQFDLDGSAGPAVPRTLATLRGVAAGAIVPSRDLVLR